MTHHASCFIDGMCDCGLWRTKEMTEITPEERLRAASLAATPGPWQQSRFVDNRRYDHMGEDWKAHQRAVEASLIRGPGLVGTPECNPVANVLTDAADATLIALARNYIEPLADVVAAARALKVRGYRSDSDGSAALLTEDSYEALRAALARLDEKEPQE